PCRMVRRQLPGLRSRQEAAFGHRRRHAASDQIQKVFQSLSYLLLKFAHVVGATVIFGTGSGIAFFMLMAHRSGDAGFIARTARLVVLADMIFTASALILQPVTGYLLMPPTG